MAEIAEVLDREELYQLSARLKQFADALVQSPQKPTPSQSAAELVRSIIRARRLRDAYLGSGLFADPAWDMLLDLYAARLERRQVSVSSLCVASAVPPTTALRWMAVLEEKSLTVKRADVRDRRRVFVEITNSTAERMRAFLTAGQAISPLVI